MKTQNTKILILGGGFAGVMSALRLARKTDKRTVQITLVSAADQLVERTRIHQLVVGQTLKTYRISHLLRNSGVQFVQGVVTALQPNQHTVTVQSAAGTNSLSYDKLVYALGSFVDRSSLPGAAEHAFTLDLASAQQLREQLPEVAKRGGRLIVIGAGLTGLEVVSEVAESYPTLQVSLLTGGTVGDDLSPKAASYVRSVLQKLSIKFYEQHNAVKIEESTLYCANGEAIPFDLAVYCGGFAVSPLAQNAGIAVNARRQMVLDERLRSLSHPDIYGAGDASTLAEDGIGLRMACATALPMACHVADALVAEINRATPTAFRFGYAARCVSLGRKAGFLQFVDAHDRPKSSVLTGCLGVWAKEAILQYVMRSIQLTRIWANAYRWPHSLAAKEVTQRENLQFTTNV